jgi:tRNA (adenine57-N1/adenine58-N1)-methyltransferase catalytic subunit
MITLRPGGSSDLRGGRISHDDLLGREEGGLIRSTRGERLLVIRPGLGDFVLQMPRGAQVVYPKDLGAILIAADLFPGARILEAGTGSGSLTMALLRAVGPTGRVTSYEVRDDFARTAERNIQRFLGPMDTLALRRRDVYEGVAPEDLPLDRVILDVPEPWRAVRHAAEALRPGGVFLAYLPTVPQIVQTVDALRATGRFAMVDTIEVLLRSWNIEGRSVRPSHRMVGHTGFIVSGRRIQPVDDPSLIEASQGAGHIEDPGTRVASDAGDAEEPLREDDR